MCGRAGRLVSMVLVGATLASACATGRARHRDDPGLVLMADSLASAIGKVREVSARARPVAKQTTGPTIETQDPALAAALLALAVSPCAETHRAVAREYARVGIFDAGFKHYQAATRLDPYDGAAYDGLARLWRDARLPQLAVGDARRAVYYAPRSPEARNTLGTVLQALGLLRDARQAYENVLVLAPAAPYALNNLGYLAFVEGDTPLAISYLRRALEAGGNTAAASHNLALAYAASGRRDLAREALTVVDAGPRVDYNLGIIDLARGDRPEALRAFDAACRATPAESGACARAHALRSATSVPAGGTQ